MAYQSLKPLWWGVVLPLAGLIILGAVVATDRTLPAWDTAFLLRLHRYATPELNRAMGLATDLGTVWGVLPVACALFTVWLWQGHYRQGLYLAMVMGGSAMLNMSTKLLWHRVRPGLWEGVPYHSDFSFPSGHATYSMTLVLALLLLGWKIPQRPWMLVVGGMFVGFVGFSRVYLGAHYPSDVLGGWLLATAWAVGLYYVMFRVWPVKPWR